MYAIVQKNATREPAATAEESEIYPAIEDEMFRLLLRAFAVLAVIWLIPFFANLVFGLVTAIMNRLKRVHS
jgi:hypothetical protein